MAAPAKQTSRWGSFLQQALDGVESRLDNILVGEGTPDTVGGSVVVGATASVKPENGSLRSSLNTGATSDRLQERLARAVAAKKYAASKTDNYTSSSNAPSRTGSPVANTDAPRRSTDNLSLRSEDAYGDKKRRSLDEEKLQAQTTDPESTGILIERAQNPVDGISPKISREESPRPSMDSNLSSAARLSVESPLPAKGGAATAHALNAMSEDTVTERSPNPIFENGTRAKQQRNNEEIFDLQRQQEIHEYIERIDALQSKLQYLARESAESARKIAATSSNSAEKKLAEKDEKIALLMEEGQKLSKAELKHMTIIKKLRAKTAEAEKENTDYKNRLEKADKEKGLILERLSRTEAAEKLSLERQKMVAQLQKDNETLTIERDSKDSNIAELKAQLLESMKQANADEVRAVQELVVQERRRVSELENDLSSLKVEKELAAGRAKAQLEELRAKIEREAERSRIAEVEMRAEQQMLESRLEVMRTRAEEVSSGSTGDAQAKFLRQIETLQTQYAIASENWQGIEASLTARATSLEKERDEVSRRETDIRRKAREVTSKAKRNEEELEDTRSRLVTLELELTGQKQEVERLQRMVSESESARIEARKTFEQEKQAWKVDLHQNVEDDRTKWREDTILYPPFSIREGESQALSHKGLTADLLGLQNRQSRNPTRSITGEIPVLDNRASRKSSTQRIQSSGDVTPQRQNSGQSFSNEEDFEPPLLQAGDHDSYFEHVLSPSPTNQTLQDVVSVSTVGAGPSVQLVERMSAAVRRLESEKVSTKEEVRRLSAQRDEARAQTLKLLQEVESKRSLDSRIQELVEENNKINARYQTTLEMLGEKSELVEELKADVQDVKDMYRELVERTIR